MLDSDGVKQLGDDEDGGAYHVIWRGAAPKVAGDDRLEAPMPTAVDALEAEHGRDAVR